MLVSSILDRALADVFASHDLDETAVAHQEALAQCPAVSRVVRRRLTREMQENGIDDAWPSFAEIVKAEWREPLTDKERTLSRAIVRLLGYRQWFHGGAPGRMIGETLLPAGLTGADPRREGGSFPGRTEFVYFTQWTHIARHYASFCAGGRIYEVEPVGEIAIDPVSLRTHLLIHSITGIYVSLGELTSFCCPAAKVIRITPIEPKAFWS